MLLPQPKQNLSLQICYIFSNTLRKHQLKLQHLQETLLSKIAIVKSFIQGLLMLIRGTQSCFKFRIIFAERRCKYLFVTNIFGNFFIVCRKTISHEVFLLWCSRQIHLSHFGRRIFHLEKVYCDALQSGICFQSLSVYCLT